MAKNKLSEAKRQAAKVQGQAYTKVLTIMAKRWQQATDQHMEIAVQDRHDGCFLSALDGRAKVTCQAGNVSYDDVLPLLWAPFLCHYGSNLHVDGESEHNFEVTIQQPKFVRHDKLNGKRHPRTVTLSFANIHLTPERAPRAAE